MRRRIATFDTGHLPRPVTFRRSRHSCRHSRVSAIFSSQSSSSHRSSRHERRRGLTLRSSRRAAVRRPGASAPRFSATLRVARLAREGRARLSERTEMGSALRCCHCQLVRPVEEELDAAQGDGRAPARVLLDILDVEEILSEFFLGDLVWGLVRVLRQLPHSPDGPSPAYVQTSP